jgi:hypothetical protein
MQTGESSRVESSRRAGCMVILGSDAVGVTCRYFAPAVSCVYISDTGLRNITLQIKNQVTLTSCGINRHCVGWK